MHCSSSMILDGHRYELLRAIPPRFPLDSPSIPPRFPLDSPSISLLTIPSFDSSAPQFLLLIWKQLVELGDFAECNKHDGKRDVTESALPL